MNTKKPQPAALTPAEYGVLRLLPTGATNKEIAEALHIEETTVKKHITNLLRKTGLRNRVALAVHAYENAPPAKTGRAKTDYALLCEQLAALSDGVSERITVLANAAALLYNFLPQINWAGFYLARERELALGPFMGKPACVRIPYGKGVCGTAAANGETLSVPDVHRFPGHIACDCASNAEIVVPIRVSNALYGVLDIDSPVRSRFSSADRKGLEAFVKTLETYLADPMSV